MNMDELYCVFIGLEQFWTVWEVGSQKINIDWLGGTVSLAKAMQKAYALWFFNMGFSHSLLKPDLNDAVLKANNSTIG